MSTSSSGDNSSSLTLVPSVELYSMMEPEGTGTLSSCLPPFIADEGGEENSRLSLVEVVGC
jgi:hypothetical protein